MTEQIPDQGILTFLYRTALGRVLLKLFFAKGLFSRLYARSYRGKRSKSRIKVFIDKYDIAVGEFESRNYASFNDFFIRKFRPHARSFVTNPILMPAFAEARYLAWDKISSGQRLPVKGRHFTVEALLNSRKKAAAFREGPVIVARLAPQDYHRVHFVDSGQISAYYRLEGTLHSVNPIALESIPGLLCANTREVTFQETDHFGTIIYIEIGAMTIGGIVQVGCPGGLPRRGEEKSYFEYGGSTVVVLGQPNRWLPDTDILAHTKRGVETFVELGSRIAHRIV